MKFLDIFFFNRRKKIVYSKLNCSHYQFAYLSDWCFLLNLVRRASPAPTIAAVAASVAWSLDCLAGDFLGVECFDFLGIGDGIGDACFLERRTGDALISSMESSSIDEFADKRLWESDIESESE